MKQIHATLTAAAMAGLVMLSAGCGGKTGTTAVDTEATPAPAALASLFAAVPRPEVVHPIPELRKAVAPGDDIVLEAKVMGVLQPFVNNRAVFVVGDEGIILSCDVMADDHGCDTPWDACCEDPRNLKAGTATIQVVDEEGQVIRHGIRGVGGLAELSRVRVAGRVADVEGSSALIVNAHTIEVL